MRRKCLFCFIIGFAKNHPRCRPDHRWTVDAKWAKMMKVVSFFLCMATTDGSDPTGTNKASKNASSGAADDSLGNSYPLI